MTPSADPVLTPRDERRLEWVLRSFSEQDLAQFAKRLAIRIDPTKRIDAVAQVARGLVGFPEIRDPLLLPPASAGLLQRAAEAGGVVWVPSIPAGLEQLVARGILFARRLERGFELVLPTAQLVQIPSWPGEEPRAIRALLAQASFETLSAIASHYLGRAAAPPLALALERAYEAFHDPAALRSELEQVGAVEERLLHAIEAVGGEVDTAELLDLEKEPLRLRGAAGVSTSRRGAGFALERRGFLVPVHPNRHVIPTEVSALLSAQSLQARAAERAQVRAAVLSDDHAPVRARFAVDPAPLAVAIACLVRDPDSEVRAQVPMRSSSTGTLRAAGGTPRTLLQRLGQRFGRGETTLGLVVATSRTLGLWDPGAHATAMAPGSLTMAELAAALHATWRRGGAWDEGRPDPEILRAPDGAREPSPSRVLRDLVEEAFRELGEGRWVPAGALLRYVLADPRIPGVERLFRRWAERLSLPVPSCDGVARQILLESLPALGVVDVGDGENDTVVRMTARGRDFLAGGAGSGDASPAQIAEDGRTLRSGRADLVGSLLSLAPFVDVLAAQDALEVSVSTTTLGRALAGGMDPTVMRARLEALVALPTELRALLEQASAVLARLTFVPAGGFLWIEDEDVRELLRTRKQTAELFVDPSPRGGLLVAPDADADKVVRRCRSVGVEIESNGTVLRARSAPAIPAVGRRSTIRPRPKTPPTREP